MKPIPANFGFWILMTSSFGMTLMGNSTASAIFMVGALLFDAIKNIDKQGE